MNITEIPSGSLTITDNPNIGAIRSESSHPYSFRFAQYPDGRRILQGGYIWQEGFKTGIIWRDLPVVKVDENGNEVTG
jgi:hypothetical protein